MTESKREVLATKLYRISWPDENGPEWLCIDNLKSVMFSTVHIGEKAAFGVNVEEVAPGQRLVRESGADPVGAIEADLRIAKSRVAEEDLSGNAVKKAAAEGEAIGLRKALRHLDAIKGES